MVSVAEIDQSPKKSCDRRMKRMSSICIVVRLSWLLGDDKLLDLNQDELKEEICHFLLRR
jgi:hypothetical protein